MFFLELIRGLFIYLFIYCINLVDYIKQIFVQIAINLFSFIFIFFCDWCTI